VVDGYKAPTVPPTNKNGKKLEENNFKSKNSIMNGLVDSVYFKVMHCDSTKEIWDKLHNVYESIFVQKVLISIPMRFDPKILVL
jgi:hypothetical protein